MDRNRRRALELVTSSTGRKESSAYFAWSVGLFRPRWRIPLFPTRNGQEDPPYAKASRRFLCSPAFFNNQKKKGLFVFSYEVNEKILEGALDC